MCGTGRLIWSQCMRQFPVGFPKNDQDTKIIQEAFKYRI